VLVLRRCDIVAKDLIVVALIYNFLYLLGFNVRNLAIFWVGTMEEEGKELLFYLLICELKCERKRLMECRFFCWFVFASHGLDGREMVKSPFPYPTLACLEQ